MALAFKVAAEAADISEDEDVVEVPIDDMVYVARRPTTAQGMLLGAALSHGGEERNTIIFDLISALMGPEALAHVKKLILARRIDFDDLLGGGSDENPDGGLIDMIFAEFAASDDRPTQPSAASSSSRAAGGRKSTGRSPGKGSTRTTSRSTGS